MIQVSEEPEHMSMTWTFQLLAMGSPLEKQALGFPRKTDSQLYVTVLD